MANFKDVDVVKKANVYFDGKVTSRTVKFSDGSKKTLGFMQAGEYEFNTDAAEEMEILSGDCEVQLAEGGAWQKYSAGESFFVRASSKFKIKVARALDYCCSFLN